MTLLGEDETVLTSELTADIHMHKQNRKRKRLHARVVTAFAAEQSGDLELQVGQVVVLTKSPLEKNWWRGYIIGVGTKGIFPRACVEVVDAPLSAAVAYNKTNRVPGSSPLDQSDSTVCDSRNFKQTTPLASAPAAAPVAVYRNQREKLLQRAGCVRYTDSFVSNGIEDEFIDVLDLQGCESASVCVCVCVCVCVYSCISLVGE